MTAESLARWVEALVGCDLGAHWCPDLAGLIAGAPDGLLDEQTVQYGSLTEYADSDGVRTRQPHEWTISNVARWAVIPYADLDVSSGYAVEQELGEALVELDGCDLEPDARDALDDLLARLWELLLDPWLVCRSMLDDRAELRRVQADALASIGVDA